MFFDYQSLRPVDENCRAELMAEWKERFARAGEPGRHVSVMKFRDKDAFRAALRELEGTGVSVMRCQDGETGLLLCFGISFRFAEKLAGKFCGGEFRYVREPLAEDCIKAALEVDGLEWLFHRPLANYMCLLRLC